MSAQDVIDGYNIRGLRKFLIAQLREAAFALWGPPGEFAQRRCMISGWPGPTGRAPKAQEATGQTLSDLTHKHSPISAGRGASCRFATRPALRSGRATHTQPKRSRYFRTQPFRRNTELGADRFERAACRLRASPMAELAGENVQRLGTFASPFGERTDPNSGIGGTH